MFAYVCIHKIDVSWQLFNSIKKLPIITSMSSIVERMDRSCVSNAIGPVTAHVHMSIQSFCSTYDATKQIIPGYQRLFDWDKKATSRFLLTVLTGGYIPPLLLASLDEEEFEILDGQHRNASIRAFRDGTFITNKKGKDVPVYIKTMIDGVSTFVFYAKTTATEAFAGKHVNTSFFNQIDKETFDAYLVGIQTFVAPMGEVEKRRIFNCLQGGKPVRNSDKDKNEMDSAFVRMLFVGRDYEQQVVAEYLPSITSKMSQNRVYLLARYALLALGAVGAKFVDDTTIKKVLINSGYDGMIQDHPNKVTMVHTKIQHMLGEVAKVRKHLSGAKLTPHQMFAFCCETFEAGYDSSTMVARVSSRFNRFDTMKQPNVDGVHWHTMWIKKKIYEEEVRIEQIEYFNKCRKRLRAEEFEFAFD